MPNDPVPILSIRQTRALTDEEHDALHHSWRALVLPEADCRFCDWIRRAFDAGLWLLLIVTLGIIDRLRAIDPALTLVVAVIGFGLPLLMFLGRRRGKRMERAWRARNICADAVYTLGVDGISRRHGGVNFSCGWRDIKTLGQDSNHLVAHINPVYALQIAKATFAGQDAESFCAELERRWQAAKSGTGQTQA